ncbi:MAG: type II secretory pathway, component PulD [Opitutaceae bacterium]|nr:type II secretory pathway, component PulD [Opitutaceae bacterium]
MILRPLFIAGLVLSSPVVFSQTPPVPSAATAPAEEMIDQIKLADQPLDAVLQLLEMLTGKTVLRPAALPTATTNLIINRPMPKSEAILALETVLAMNQIGVAPMGDKFLKVVALPSLRTESPRMLVGSALDLPASGSIMAKVFQLNFLRANEFVPQLAQLLNPQLGGPILFDKTNAVMITDSVSTLQRIESLILQLDKPVTANLTPKFYPLQFAKASVLVNQLKTILQGPVQAQLGSATTYSSDDRTNQVILLADSRQHEFFDALITKLDVKADPNTRNEVIYLKHAAAKDVAALISQLVSGQNKAVSSSSQQSVRPGQVTPVVNATTPAAPAAGTPPAPNIVNIVGPNLLEGTAEFSSLVTILPDERSNAVVISGTVDDIRIIRELVEKVDVLLAQVRIEVVIAEVTISDEASTGIETLGLKVAGDKLVGFSGALAGPSLSIANGTVTRGDGVSGVRDLAAEISIQTTPRKGNTNILSVPAIVTTHNKEARFFVGESRPVISSYLADNSGTGNSATVGGYRSTVSQQEIGIELKVKPLIGNDGSVQLDIKQKVEDVLGTITIDNNPQPRIGKRETESFVSIQSGEIVVLGGLQRDSQSKTTNRLGPIPILGDLFGSRRREKGRTDLVFFVRPYVLTNSSVDNAETMSRLEGNPQKDAVLRALAPPVADTPASTETSPSLRRPK